MMYSNYYYNNFIIRPYQINYLFIIPSLSNFGPWQKIYLFFCACARCALIRISVCTNQKLTQKMVFVIVQIRSGATILKTWYGCSIPEGSSLADVYTSFSSGQLDHGLPIPEEYQDSTVVVKVGKSRSDLIIVSIECSVAEIVSNLGQYMDFASEEDFKEQTECYPICETCHAGGKRSPARRTRQFKPKD